MHRILLTILFLSLINIAHAADSDEFPLRAVHPKVKYITLSDLSKRYEDVHLVDARSAYEYDTLHIKGAVNISVDDPSFVKNVTALRAKDNKPIVFYCNGKTCAKSYEAWDKADSAGINNILTYDAGVFDWARQHPDKSVLLGKTPIKVSDLITTAQFNEHLLGPDDFAARIGHNTILLDIRDRLQRAGMTFYPVYVHQVPMDNSKLKQYIDEAKSQNKTLLVFDEVGKQVVWLQYYLEDQKVPSYYFLKGGVRALLK